MKIFHYFSLPFLVNHAVPTSPSPLAALSEVCLILEIINIDALQRFLTADVCDIMLYDVLCEVCNENGNCLVVILKNDGK